MCVLFWGRTQVPHLLGRCSVTLWHSEWRSSLTISAVQHPLAITRRRPPQAPPGGLAVPSCLWASSSLRYSCFQEPASADVCAAFFVPWTDLSPSAWLSGPDFPASLASPSCPPSPSVLHTALCYVCCSPASALREERSAAPFQAGPLDALFSYQSWCLAVLFLLSSASYVKALLAMSLL